jgi:hypothetical protein
LLFAAVIEGGGYRVIIRKFTSPRRSENDFYGGGNTIGNPQLALDSKGQGIGIGLRRTAQAYEKKQE